MFADRKHASYNRTLSTRNEIVLLALKFVSNFNEALLTAEITQTFFKFLGINIWSSNAIWVFPPLLFIFISPIYRKVLMNKKYDTFLYNMVSLSVLFFANSIAFMVLFNLENFAANQSTPNLYIIGAGVISFTFIDNTKMIYENLVHDYMTEYTMEFRRKRFEYYGFIFEKLGRILGAFISCLYVVFHRTNFARFSDYFYTNMQFSYYFAICLNVFAVLCIFWLWPKHFILQMTPVEHNPTSLFDYFFPGANYISSFDFHNKRLIVRLFFIVGIYWFVAVNLTQWVSHKFMMDYPDIVTNSPMQAIDIGTAWGSITLTIFYTLWGTIDIIIQPIQKRLYKHSRFISRIINFFGFLVYGFCYYFYDKNIRLLIILLGLNGLCYDWLLHRKIVKKLRKDKSLAHLTKKQQKFLVDKIVGIVTFLSEITFFLIIPSVLNSVPDDINVLGISILHLLLFITIPRDSQFNL